MKKYLAIDIGGTFIKFGVYLADGQEVFSDKIPTPKEAEIFIDTLEEIIKLSEAKETIDGIGVSCPGFINPKTGENNDFSIRESFKKYNVKKELETRTKYKIAIENDAKCAVLAEKWLGAGRGCENFFVITLGTGVGGGAVINNELYRGTNFKAGEFGLAYISFNNEDGRITKKTTPSAQVLMRRVGEVLGKEVNGEYVFENLDNKKINEVYKEWLVEVSILISNLSMCFDPQKVLIGGGISAVPRLIEDLRETTNRLNGYVAEYTEIDACKFRNDAGKIGAIYNYFLQYEII